tara:strand:+ start:12 stop:761 length:750 start_codon:yes stop_codon:yes gene_type:complete
MKKRIAICLRGGMSKLKTWFNKDDNTSLLYSNNSYVPYKSCYISIMKHIVQANPDCEFDFFIQSWNCDLEEDLINLYKPKKTLFEDQRQYTDLINRNKIGRYAYTAQKLSIQKSLEIMLEYTNKNNIKYDRVIIYRPDVLLWKDMKLSNYNKDIIYVNHSLNEDFHFIMSQENSLLFSKLFVYKLSIKDFVYKIMKKQIFFRADDIKCGIHQEVIRKIKFGSIDRHNIPEDLFYKYGLTSEQIQLLTHV